MLVQDIRTTRGYVAVLPPCVVVGGEAPRSLFPSPRVPAVVLVRHQASEVVLVRGLGIPSLAGLSGWRHAHSACVLVPDFRSCAFIVFCGAKKKIKETLLIIFYWHLCLWMHCNAIYMRSLISNVGFFFYFGGGGWFLRGAACYCFYCFGFFFLICFLGFVF